MYNLPEMSQFTPLVLIWAKNYIFALILPLNNWKKPRDPTFSIILFVSSVLLHTFKTALKHVQETNAGGVLRMESHLSKDLFSF